MLRNYLKSHHKNELIGYFFGVMKSRKVRHKAGLFYFSSIVAGPGIDIRFLIHFVHKNLSAQLVCFCSMQEQKHDSARSVPTQAKQFACLPLCHDQDETLIISQKFYQKMTYKII